MKIFIRKIVMSELISYQDVKDRIMEIRGEHVLLDRDVAELYGVETKRVNEAVANNPEKFPERYIIILDDDDWDSLRSKFSTLETGGKGQYTKYKPKAFTEKGLYMLATILKSPIATQTTIAIVETFAKIREFANIMTQLPDIKEDEVKNSLIQRGGDIFAEILDDNILEVCGDEITFELDLAIMKLKRTVKREKKKL